MTSNTEQKTVDSHRAVEGFTKARTKNYPELQSASHGTKQQWQKQSQQNKHI